MFQRVLNFLLGRYYIVYMRDGHDKMYNRSVSGNLFKYAKSVTGKFAILNVFRISRFDAIEDYWRSRHDSK
jgi:hypothetical protein